MKIGFVILNYLNWQDTIECIETFKKQTINDYQLVIVDNGSNNESVEKISESISGYSNFFLIETNKNLGYSRGNNVGIKYLRKFFNINNIMLLNNDTLLIEDNYVEKLSHMKFNSQIGAIGTKIIGSDGLNQNPVYFRIDNFSLLKTVIINLLAFSKTLTFLKKKYFQKIADAENTPEINKTYFLHGSAILLTENYFRLYEGLFSETFLYYEEVILALLFKKSNLIMHYEPSLSIYHKEDRSSILSFNNDDLTRRKFLLQSVFLSLKIRLASENRARKIVNNKIIIDRSVL